MKSKIFLILYYLINIIVIGTVISYILFNNYTYFGDNVNFITPINFVLFFGLFIISLIFFIISTVLIMRKKVNVDISNIILEIVFLVFMLVIAICCLNFDKKLILKKIEYAYYLTIIFVPYILLNVYPIFSLKKQ